MFQPESEILYISDSLWQSLLRQSVTSSFFFSFLQRQYLCFSQWLSVFKPASGSLCVYFQTVSNILSVLDLTVCVWVSQRIPVEFQTVRDSLCFFSQWQSVFETGNISGVSDIRLVTVSLFQFVTVSLFQSLTETKKLCFTDCVLDSDNLCFSQWKSPCFRQWQSLCFSDSLFVSASDTSCVSQWVTISVSASMWQSLCFTASDNFCVSVSDKWRCDTRGPGWSKDTHYYVR